MSSNERPDQERRGPSGLTMWVLAELLPPLEPLPLPPLSAMAPTQSFWRVIPRLLFCIVFGALTAMHVFIFLTREKSLLNPAKCMDAISGPLAFAVLAVLCALGGASLLTKFKRLLRNRREGREAFRSPEPG